MPVTVMIDRAAELLGVSRRTVYYRIRDGRLQTLRTRGGSQRVFLDSIVALVQEDGALVTTRGADVSGTALFGKSPAP